MLLIAPPNNQKKDFITTIALLSLPSQTMLAPSTKRKGFTVNIIALSL